MNIFDANKAGLIGGAVCGICSVLWSLLVAVGWAHDLLNAAMSVKFVVNPFQIADFAWGQACLGLIEALIAGYVVGWLLATLANAARQK